MSICDGLVVFAVRDSQSDVPRPRLCDHRLPAVPDHALLAGNHGRGQVSGGRRKDGSGEGDISSG